jgi:hypothetical protein
MQVLTNLRRANAAQQAANEARRIENGNSIVEAFLDKDTPQIVMAVKTVVNFDAFVADTRARMKLCGLREAGVKSAAKPVKKGGKR